MALRNIGRPQNLVKAALWMRMWRMYLVSAGVAMGGIVSVRAIDIGVLNHSFLSLGKKIFRGLEYRLPGEMFQSWPSPWSMCSFTVLPSPR